MSRLAHAPPERVNRSISDPKRYYDIPSTYIGDHRFVPGFGAIGTTGYNSGPRVITTQCREAGWKNRRARKISSAWCCPSNSTPT